LSPPSLDTSTASLCGFGPAFATQSFERRMSTGAGTGPVNLTVPVSDPSGRQVDFLTLRRAGLGLFGAATAACGQAATRRSAQESDRKRDV
jgi:hypothetical protein